MNINRQTLENLSNDIQDLLKTIDTKYELTLTNTSMSYNEKEIDVKLKFINNPDNLSKQDIEKQEFANYAPLFGFDESDYNKKLIIKGQEHRFVAIKPKNRKYPCILLNKENNQSYKVAPEYIKYQIHLANI